MSEQLESGENMQDDVNYLRIDPVFHDVTLVSAEGDQLRACRAFLATRCKFLRTKLYPLSGAVPQIVNLDKTSLRVLEIILTFIHTDTINPVASPEIIIDAYRAATDFGLAKLQRIIEQNLRKTNIEDLSIASSLLNKAVAEMPPSESNIEMYDILLKPFRTFVLTIGQLNSLSELALELILKRTRNPEIGFNTPEHVLLLSVVEWAWARSEEAPPTTERHEMLKRLESATDPSINLQDFKIILANEFSKALLRRILPHMDLVLVCPHRLRWIEDAIDSLRDNSPLHVAALHHACTNTRCPPEHPSRIRGKYPHKFEWDRLSIGEGLIVSTDGLVVEWPNPAGTDPYRTARISCPFLMTDMGAHNIDIIFESIGSVSGIPLAQIGLIQEHFSSFNSHINTSNTYVFHSNYGSHLVPNYKSKFGKELFSGDIVTVHLCMQDRTCSLSINGISYGVAWRELPEKVYLAFTVCPSARYRISARV